MGYQAIFDFVALKIMDGRATFTLVLHDAVLHDMIAGGMEELLIWSKFPRCLPKDTRA